MTSSPPTVDAAAGLHLVAICVAVSLGAELLLWGWAYAKPEFRALRVRDAWRSGRSAREEGRVVLHVCGPRAQEMQRDGERLR